MLDTKNPIGSLETEDIENQLLNQNKESTKRERNIIIFLSAVILISIALIIIIILNLPKIEGKNEESDIIILKEDNDFEKLGFDKKKYLAVELTNGLKAVLIEDKNTKNSGVSITVGSGSYYDIVGGLAHFCEHMYFGGSKKHPDYEENMNIISVNGGAINAYTSLNHTSFFFYALNEAFENITEIFASGLEDPLFSEDFVDREINNIDSEFLLGKSDLETLTYHLYKEHMNKKHPLSMNVFSVGNNNTLNSVSHEQLIIYLKSYFNTFFRPDNMNLVLYSNYTIDEMKNIVQKYFNFNKNETKKEDTQKFQKYIEGFNEPINTKENLGKIIYFQNSKNTINIGISTEPFYSDEKDNPYLYLSYMVNSFAEGTLFEILEKYGASVTIEDDNDFSFSLISFQITFTDIQTVPEIIQIFFYYFKKLSNEGILKTHFEMIKKLFESGIKFSDVAPELYEILNEWTKKMRFLGIDRAVKQEKPIDYNEEKIKNLFKLITIKNSFIIISADSSTTYSTIEDLHLFKDGTTIKDLILDQYELSYKYGEINDALLSIDYPNEDMEKLGIKIREDNKYITELTEYVKPCYEVDEKTCGGDEYISSEENIDAIQINAGKINDFEPLKIFYQIDKSNNLPKTYLTVKLELPLSFTNKVNYLYGLIFLSIYKKKIADIIMEASESYNTVELNDNTKYNITLTIGAFSDKYEGLLLKILDRLFKFLYTEEDFEFVLNTVIYELSFSGASSFILNDSSDYFKRILMTEFVGLDYSEQDFQKLSISDFDSLVKDMIKKIKILLVIRGNINKEEVINLSEKIKPYFKDNEDFISEHKVRSIKDSKVIDFYTQHPLSEQGLTLISYQIDQNTFFENKENLYKSIILPIFEKYVGNIYFNKLRSEKNFGYTVASTTYSEDVLNFLVVFLIGNTLHPHEIEIEIDKITKGILDKSISTDYDFSSVKQNAINGLKPTKDNLFSRNNYFLYYYKYGGYQEYLNILNEAESKITESVMLEFMKEMIIEKPYRLSILYYSKNENPDEIVNGLIKDQTKYSLNAKYNIEYTKDLDILKE